MIELDLPDDEVEIWRAVRDAAVDDRLVRSMIDDDLTRAGFPDFHELMMDLGIIEAAAGREALEEFRGVVNRLMTVAIPRLHAACMAGEISVPEDDDEDFPAASEQADDLLDAPLENDACRYHLLMLGMIRRRVNEVLRGLDGGARRGAA